MFGWVVQSPAGARTCGFESVPQRKTSPHHTRKGLFQRVVIGEAMVAMVAMGKVPGEVSRCNLSPPRPMAFYFASPTFARSSSPS